MRSPVGCIVFEKPGFLKKPGFWVKKPGFLIANFYPDHLPAAFFP